MCILIQIEAHALIVVHPPPSSSSWLRGMDEFVLQRPGTQLLPIIIYSSTQDLNISMINCPCLSNYPLLNYYVVASSLAHAQCATIRMNMISL